jgi:hypothetical protein
MDMAVIRSLAGTPARVRDGSQVRDVKIAKGEVCRWKPGQ